MPLWQLHITLDQFQILLGMQVGPGGGVVDIRTLLADQIPTCLFLHIGSIRLQLLCGVSIELV